MARLSLSPADLLAFQLTQAKLTGWQREVKFHPTRKWRADFLWSDPKLIVEVDGGAFARFGAKKCRVCGETPRGRHLTGVGFENDRIKQAEAVALGYRVMAVTPRMITSGEAFVLIQKAMTRQEAA